MTDQTAATQAPPPPTPSALAAAAAAAEHRLLAEITCPNCWHVFPPEQTLFVARHDDLIGDRIVGETAYRRFLPSRFDAHGDAIDARGMACQELACPRCHLTIARPLIELPPLFTSIVGVPASGKSYYLATMTWQLRRLAAKFGFVLTDGDPISNTQLQQNEETLFMAANPAQPVSLTKTELSGEALYQTIFFDGHRQSFPRPFVFSVTPTRDRETPQFPYRSLVMYDNAGEHFLPGQDQTHSPVTLHLAQSAAIFFLFDPLQDPRFRKHCKSNDPQLTHGSRPDAGEAAQTVTHRQEVILNELAARVRRYNGLSQTARHQRPLVMILAKADAWLRDDRFDQEPFKQVDGKLMLDADVIQTVSDNCRQLMVDTCPEVIAAAEGFAERVIYLPASSLGTSPELAHNEGTRFLGIKPESIQPKWVTVPLLWTLSQTNKGLIDIA